MNYLKVWTNFRDVIQTLDDAEKGRLFDAMLLYAETGEEPEAFAGNERVIWPVAKRDIDMAMQWRETRRINGMKGGRPKTNANQQKPMQTNSNQQKPKETNLNQNEPEETLKEKKRNEIKRNETKRNEMKSSFMDDFAAADIQHEHDRILNAAEDAGFKMSNTVRARLISLYADYGMEKMLSGFNECATHGAPTLAYLEAVLKGTGKKKPVVSVLPAQDYHQRDNSDAQEAAFERMMALSEMSGA
ncbi:MAG: hypothetical protein IIZ93_14565 [Acidaminococcaceae bacterium]|nr:hypothetical protein [Acidaminococcaceae bacterium]